MKVACSCIVMVLMMAGCATTGRVDQMIDAKMTPQIEQINAQFEAQSTAAAATLEDMKGFVSRLGTTLDKDIKDLQSGVADLKRQVAVVKTDVNGSKSNIKDVEAEVSKLDSTVKSISARVTSMRDAVETVKVQTADAKEAAEAASKLAYRAIGEAK